MKTHAIEYRHEGSTWIIEVPAASQEDAMQRLSIASQYGTYLGSVEMVLPVGSRFFANLVCWWKNRGKEG